MKKYIIGILFFSFCINLTAQEIKISGYVVCKGTRERIPEANVYEQNSQTGTTSNEYGFYSISIPAGDSAILTISHVAYKEVKFIIPAYKDLHLDIVMEPGYLLQEVTIKDSTRPAIDKRLEISNVYMPAAQIKKIPSVTGEPDVLRALQLSPGVATGGEGSAEIYVRGGSPEQNLFLIDDVPLYYVNHLGGFMSVFNTDAIKSVELIKGGFPANYGNRLSSILDVQMKEGDYENFRGNLTLGLINSKVFVEGPIKTGTTSYLFSARRFMYDLITYPSTKILIGNGQSVAYTFYDLNFRIDHKLNDKNIFSINTYLGNDSYFIKTEYNSYSIPSYAKLGIQWGNRLASLSWKHFYNNRFTGKINLSYSQYNTSNRTSNQSTEDGIKYKSKIKYLWGISDIISDISFEYRLWKTSKLKFGVSNTFQSFAPGNYRYFSSAEDNIIADSVSSSEKLNGINNAAYLLGEFHFGKYVSFNPGFRMSHYRINSCDYFSSEPRAIIMFKIPKLFTVKAAYAKMQQNAHMLTSTGIGIPVDRWFPATDLIPPSKAVQYDAGIARSFFNNSVEVSVDAFYKEMDNLIYYKKGIDFTGFSDDWASFIEKGGKGKSKGIEFFINKLKGRMTGFVSYTLSRTTRQFENINDGLEFPYKYDRTHSINISWSYELRDNISIASNWVYGTGNAISLPSGIINTIEQTFNINSPYDPDNYNNTAFIYDEVNNYRMRDYHRLDIGINFIKSTKWGERTLNFSIYNVYNRQNPYYYFMDYDSGQKKYILTQQSLFPFMPSVSYSVNFNKVSIKEGLEQYKRTKQEWFEKNKKHNFGGQYNNLIGYDDGYDRKVYALRYGYSINHFIRFGLEYSGSIRKKNYFPYTSKGKLNNFGAFIRIKYSKLKYLHPFLESSGYYSIDFYIIDNSSRLNYKRLSGYVAPGITINLLENFFNFDIFYKFSPHEIIFDKKSVITYRVCFNF